MRRYVHEAVVDTPPDKLWRASVDVRRRPEWDAGLEVWGPLGFLWDRVVARKVAQDAGAQTEAFVRFAERLP
jgi:hypothetical protein